MPPNTDLTELLSTRSSCRTHSHARRFLPACVGAASLAWVVCAVAAGPLQDRRLIVGSEQDHPPFAIGSTDATAGGFTVELWEAVAKEQDLAYSIRVRPFDELLQGFKSGDVDALLNLAKSDDRRTFADFSATHVAVGGAIFVRKGDGQVRAEEDLSGKSIIVIKADPAHDCAVGKGWQVPLVPVDTAEQGLRLLTSGQHDAMLISKLAGLQTIHDCKFVGLAALDARVGISQRFAFAVRKGDVDLLARINEGLALTWANAEFGQLYDRWFGPYDFKPIRLRDIWPAAALLGLVAATAWSISLRNRRRRDRLAAATLRDSEERWKFALEGAGDGVWDADLAAGTSLYSRRWKEILGYGEDEIGTAASEWSDRIHPDDLARVLHENQVCIDGHADTFVSEFRMRAKDGQWVWILDRGKVVRRSRDGKALRMIGTHADISERKANEAHEARRARLMTRVAAGDQLPAILETLARDVESASDWKCSILLADPSGTRLLVGAAPTLPEPFCRIVDGMPIAPNVGTCGAAARARTRVVTEDIHADAGWDRYRDAADQAGLRACWSEPILGAGGALLGTFAAYHARSRVPAPAEIANLVEAAQIASIAIERRRGEQALRDSEERLQRALDASRLALWDLDLVSGEVYLSDAWSEMMGGKRVSTSTTFDALAALVPEEDQARIAASMADTLRGVAAGYSVEHRVLRPDGQTLWIVSRGRVVERDANGRALRAVGTNRDISDRKRAEATRRVLESQLREAQKLEAIGTLAGGIAHDFNNIMAAILGNVAFARQDLSEGHIAQTYLTQIQKAGLRARSLVQQILAFSRLQPNEFISLALREIVEETVTMLRSMASVPGQLHAVLPERTLAVMGNPTQLQQVLLNLGTNAFQALRDGTGLVVVGLEEVVLVEAGERPLPPGLAAGNYAHVWVHDDGCGMDDATRQRIFEPFFTTKQVGQGTGLGLAVAHGIVEAHGGAIAVASEVGRGSTFDVYLPLVDYESKPMPLEATLEESLRGRGQHVLYVDDDEVMVLMVQGLLQRLGYRATCVQDAREAITMVERDPTAFDLVVTDFNMPNCSGLDVVRALGSIRPDLPVAISSGYVSDELRLRSAELGVHGVMQKDHTLEQLGFLVYSALEAASAKARQCGEGPGS